MNDLEPARQHNIDFVHSTADRRASFERAFVGVQNSRARPRQS